ARLANGIAVESYAHRDAEHGKVERAAPTQLHVGGASSLRRRQDQLGEDLVRLLGEILDAVVAVERLHGNHARARRAHEPNVRAEAPRDGCRVRGRYRPAARTARRHETNVAVLLHTEA